MWKSTWWIGWLVIFSIGCHAHHEPTTFDKDVERYLQDAQRLVNYCRNSKGDALYFEQASRLIDTQAGLLPLKDRDREITSQINELHEQLRSLVSNQHYVDSCVQSVAAGSTLERYQQLPTWQKNLVGQTKDCQLLIDRLLGLSKY